MDSLISFFIGVKNAKEQDQGREEDEEEEEFEAEVEIMIAGTCLFPVLFPFVSRSFRRSDEMRWDGPVLTRWLWAG